MSRKAIQRTNAQAAQSTPLVQREKKKREEKSRDDAQGYALPFSYLSGLKWLAKWFPHIATAAPGERHKTLWNWIDALRPGVKPKAKIDIWPRGGAKSSTAELGVAKAGAALNRRFALYICETQDQADEHVGNIGTLFEEMGVKRAVNKYGSSKGWKRDELRTENGFNVSGIGLDVAKRGVRLGKYRPDFIIIDDVDGLNDTKATTAKKIRTITQSLLPAGSSDCAVLFVQNKIIATGIAAQLADGTADFLADREPVVEEPAIKGLEVKRVQQPDGTWLWKIIKGIPTWVHQSIQTCEKQIAEWSLSAFLREAQHKVDLAEGGLWVEEHDITPFRHFAKERYDEILQSLTKIVVAVDPSGSETGDEAGIVVAGMRLIGKVVHVYILESMVLSCAPEVWATAALDVYDAWEADELVAEVNFGGDMVESTFKAAGIDRARKVPPVTLVSVSRGKLIRALPIKLLSEKGQVHHVEHFGDSDIGGVTHKALEMQLCKWQPGMPSPGALDSYVIATSRLFGLAEMVKEVKRPAAFSGGRLIGSARKSGSSPTASRRGFFSGKK